MVSAIAQLERDLIRERVTAGIRNARSNGTKLGRPKNSVHREQILELKAQGKSLRSIATNLEVSVMGRFAIDSKWVSGKPNKKRVVKTPKERHLAAMIFTGGNLKLSAHFQAQYRV
jgi:DNA invertase Pin-like site-specific DNA recombinase